MSGLFVAQSGVPLNITGSGTVLNTPGTTPYVNLTGDNRIVGGLGQGNLYFDPSVYTQPAAGVQGNMTRNSGPEGPGFWEIDSSLFKRFAISGSRYAEFRVDAYNVTNSVRWGNPNTDVQHGHGQHVRSGHGAHRQPAEPPVRGEVCVLITLPASRFQLPALIDGQGGAGSGALGTLTRGQLFRRHKAGSWKREAGSEKHDLHTT